MWKSGEDGIAVDPHPDSLCFKRLRAMVASRAETLGGDEASRLRTMPLSLVGREEVSGRSDGRGERCALCRVGVGDEGVDHEIAVKRRGETGRSSMISVEDVHVHMLERRLVRLGVVDVEGRHRWGVSVRRGWAAVGTWPSLYIPSTLVSSSAMNP